MASELVSDALSLVGAAAGGAAGFVVFRWIAGQGFYAPFVIGGLAGLACLALARRPSLARGIACGILALLIELFAEATVFPFAKDERIGFFFTHLHWLPPVKLVMIALGGVMAAYLGRDHAGSRRAVMGRRD